MFPGAMSRQLSERSKASTVAINPTDASAFSSVAAAFDFEHHERAAASGKSLGAFGRPRRLPGR